MSDQQFDVFFRGDIVAGQAVVEVKERLAGLFKLEAAQVEQLFSGRPNAIRRNLDEASAKKYEQALLKIGAVAELRPAKEEASPSPQATGEGGLSLAPAGSDVLRPDERASVAAAEVDVSALALEPGGGEILRDDEKRSVEAKAVDTSHLEVLPPR
ncbi:MAG: hypothetical protein KBT88_07490 [Gammaproteobacteria bacterium]|nr:hypothetical protein [Gammaproteobacteria bacterium]MBQ0839615.1 hypothetical protein [Gammaproteobacteria bacterium]